jgi:predicted alpha/beta-hydrolase family hydrolase
MSDPMEARPLTLTVDATQRISALLLVPPRAQACYVLAHGAGAGMTHPFLEAVATGLGERRIATLRFQFPFMEKGSKRTDTPAVAHTAVRAAVAEACRLVPRLPLIAGGRSFGGRMTSQAQALSPLPGVKALAFLAFPLHPAKRPSDERAAHLSDVRVPMLFLQGTRDTLGDEALLHRLVTRLGRRATLQLFEGADHAFHVPARSGRKDGDIRRAMLDGFAAWVDSVVLSTT